MKKILAWVLSIFLIVSCGSLDSKTIGINKYINKGASRSVYIPPNKCYVEVSYEGYTAWLNVTGLNSTVFCRRVIAGFEDDNYFTVINVDSINLDRPLICTINGDNFKFDILSYDYLGEYLCKELNRGMKL